MNTFALHCILSKVLKNVHFLGVYAHDKIPKSIPKYPACFVANTDNTGKPGQHWIAVYLANSSSCEFFDSYGMPPSTYHFSFPNRSVVSSSNKLQRFNTSVCGHYCIYFLMHRCNLRKPFKSAIMSLAKLNDVVVKKRIDSLRISHPCNTRLDCPSQCCTANSKLCQQ